MEKLKRFLSLMAVGMIAETRRQHTETQSGEDVLRILINARVERLRSQLRKF